ncbi:endonuclease/exonuclease/phosphatase family protein [Lentibacter sp. XHP0401]|jgi:Endonuclease/Exonuclease/phosphatase family|uniref:endonuclease/exonuclease/phosphatase family protein n=1 Tax=Lentibacter sp. XHP0401 TaxID=2984334 RepID=UPI0021E773EB|nr:endonuclease/exonuclease/phosphatase family protein [Lentibacter sp. XHP0401]MCV2893240.1 endonuclease/exonuclease/phosphatase family protein [Lentibacter sp. XHP0401]
MAYYGLLKNNILYPEGRKKPGEAGWIADHLLALRRDLAEQIKATRKPNSLILGSWNIRHFDGGRPRLRESFHYIAEIIDHFDICAVQEVKDIESVERLVKLLGSNWDFFINDSSGSGRGNHERMAFLYNRNRVSFRNLIGELVFPHDLLPGGEQIGRTPFFAAFQAGWFKFTLCSSHIVYEEADGRPLREDEIGAIARLLKSRAKDTEEVHIFLGDMNIDKVTDRSFQILLEEGYIAPLFGATNLTGDKTYDQITFTGPQDEARLLRYGAFDWRTSVFKPSEEAAYEATAMSIRERPDTGKPYGNWAREYPKWCTHEMSDHLPVWIEIEVDYSDEYLQAISDAQLTV